MGLLKNSTFNHDFFRMGSRLRQARRNWIKKIGGDQQSLMGSCFADNSLCNVIIAVHISVHSLKIISIFTLAISARRQAPCDQQTANALYM